MPGSQQVRQSFSFSLQSRKVFAESGEVENETRGIVSCLKRYGFRNNFSRVTGFIRNILIVAVLGTTLLA
ncbi:MAG: hypothetical protein WDO06_05140 [Actinomycetota bacterium]